jgi:hypothetical protein
LQLSPLGAVPTGPAAVGASANAVALDGVVAGGLPVGQATWIWVSDDDQEGTAVGGDGEQKAADKPCAEPLEHRVAGPPARSSCGEPGVEEDGEEAAEDGQGQPMDGPASAKGVGRDDGREDGEGHVTEQADQDA